MNILFIENRGSSYLLDRIGKLFSKSNHDIFWIIQNRLYSPKSGQKFYLGKCTDNTIISPADIANFRHMDRGIKFFGGNNLHYGFYYNKISEIIQKINPDIVFGECTQFHEYITIQICKNKKIPYIVPNATRYPVNRLVFNYYDTYEVVGGNNLKLSYSDAKEQVLSIMNNIIQPSYMDKKRNPIVYFHRLFDLVKVFFGRVFYDKYITPSLIIKLFLELKLIYFKIIIYNISTPYSKLPNSFALYPLQMQPESNIDIYGYPNNDQSIIIKKLYLELSKFNIPLVVKPNPKSKYELNSSLIKILKNNRIYVVGCDVKMSDLFEKVCLVITNTGTVLLESIFKSKPVLCIGNHSFSKYPGVYSEPNLDKLSSIIDSIKSYKPLNFDEKVEFYNDLFSSSYDARLFDPTSSLELINENEIKKLFLAFKDILLILKKDSVEDGHI